MIPRQWALIGLIAFNAILVFMVTHLAFFAAEGARYTADDGR